MNKRKIYSDILNIKKIIILTLFVILSFFNFPLTLYSLETSAGEILFKNNCAGCHINGGNIIRRSKNLKFSTLKRNGIQSPEVIANIASKGIGIMDGYEEQLGENGDQIVADWIWQRAQNAWIQE